MDQKESIKKMLVGLIMIIAAATGLTLVVGMFIGGNGDANKAPTEVERMVKTFEVDKSKLPDKLPTDLPIEAGAEITQNYNATTEDGRYQATRAFITSKSLADNYNSYSQYLRTNGWTIQSTVNEPTYKTVMGSKGNQQLQVSISQNSVSKVPTVTISLTELP